LRSRSFPISFPVAFATCPRVEKREKLSFNYTKKGNLDTHDIQHPDDEISRKKSKVSTSSRYTRVNKVFRASLSTCGYYVDTDDENTAEVNIYEGRLRSSCK